jgi:hypothetical protein
MKIYAPGPAPAAAHFRACAQATTQLLYLTGCRSDLGNWRTYERW